MYTLITFYIIMSQVLGTEAIDVTEVFIRLQRRQVVYNVAILIFITVLLIFFVRGNQKNNNNILLFIKMD